MPRSKCSGHSCAPVGSSPGTAAAKAANAFAAQLVPVRQQLSRRPVDSQWRVRLQRCGRQVHLLRRARCNAGEVGDLRHGSDPGPALLPVTGDDELVEVHREHAGVGPEHRSREPSRGGYQPDASCAGVAGRRQHMLGKAVPRISGSRQ